MKKRYVWLAVGALASAWTFAEEAKTQEDVHATGLASGERIVVDGRLDDIAWQRATAYPLAHIYAPTAVTTETPETVYRVMADREYLYIGIDCRDPNPKAIWQALAHRDAVSNADTVKVWIDPQGARKFAQIFKAVAGGVFH